MLHRATAAIGLVTLAHCVLACGQVTRQTKATDCEDRTCDGQSEFARPVVRSAQPLELTNPQQDSVTWPIWGSAFTLAEVVRARVTVDAGARTGLVFALPGEPEQRRAFALVWGGTSWNLTEAVGDAAPLQQATLRAARSTTLGVEVRDGGRTITITSADGKTASLTSQATIPAAATMGIDVQLAPGARLTIKDLELSEPLPPSGLGTPLRALARARGRALGSTSETGEWPPRHDLAFESMYAEQFAVAGVLDFYWTTTRGEDEDFNFLPADLMVNYATVHDQTINGYFLVWDEALPDWVGQLAETQGAAGLGAMLDKHIATIVSRYRGRVSSWIVANESFLGPDETGTGTADYAHNVWFDTLGADYIARAFRDADRADPDATLIYNETGAEAEGAKADFLYARVSELKASGVPIDAVGLQFHVDAAHPPDLGAVKRNMQRLGALGLDVLITELDVNLASLPGTHAQRLAKQAQLFAGVVDTCLAVSACKTITTFGFSDKHGWDELGPAVCKPDGSTRLCSEPLLFTRDYQPKPAYSAFRAALGG